MHKRGYYYITYEGWILVRRKGSHRHFKHLTKKGIVTVSGKPGSDVRIGTLKKVLKQAGLNE